MFSACHSKLPQQIWIHYRFNVIIANHIHFWMLLVKTLMFDSRNKNRIHMQSALKHALLLAFIVSLKWKAKSEISVNSIVIAFSCWFNILCRRFGSLLKYVFLSCNLLSLKPIHVVPIYYSIILISVNIRSFLCWKICFQHYFIKNEKKGNNSHLSGFP